MSNHIGQSTRAQMRLSSVTEVLACMRLLVSLRFRMGTRSLPHVTYHIGVVQALRHLPAQRMCQRCNLHAPHDDRHLVSERPAMQCVRDRYPALVNPAINTMQAHGS